ncbi:pilin [Variovorax sp. J22G73]|uniref:pilin n=1 Tax=unclassified Variovorax TaxID=663243 RepID=UPI000E32BD8F|nr:MULTISPECIES: pilin [unclassified Variovorax]MDM0009201.1 pilin [Variovorax sp. J22R203]MDM0101863.1 pilin [Variovorax sp. J22G73]
MNRFGKASFVAQKGFTLIELMIVIAVVGILTAIAMPSYQNYTAKAQSSEALTLAESVKYEVELIHGLENRCPNNATVADATIDISTNIKGRYVDKIVTAGNVTEGCTVQTTFKTQQVNSKISGQTITWKLAAGANTSQWGCVTSLGPSLIPHGCGPAQVANSGGGSPSAGGSSGGTAPPVNP